MTDIFSHSLGFKSFSLAVPSNVCMAAARLPARSEPTSIQFFFPIAIGLMQFSTGLLSIGGYPVSA